ncbi:KUP/HAK/KT family potassium transporter [uncultured Flavobacterium sp.]|uniref:KUP/HAK/KT family potassium transporter n=1 Tax=uncultured Flavobacterium sp. TaxID=165435 RepID=UPI0025D4FC6D|nr:KUP/HAK/KT family potassium transporter [uncultured Flavobacterium sp.]
MGKHIHKLSAAGLLVTLGIIFGDIGTSPLYVLKAIVGNDPINSRDIIGAISAIFWTLTLQTTIKYVIIMLRADNKGEGGIFSLYTLIRKTKIKWLLFPAIIGGSTLLADGIITPPISVSSAIEGLIVINPDIPIIPIVIVIITILFGLQQFGTKLIGKFFGPVMFIWFTMLGVLGTIQLGTNLNVLSAFNPYHAYELLMNHKQGFLILGAVFLCTTGAEALYSDLGHCGKENIRVSWIFVKIMLLLNYFGQGAWLISHEGKSLASMGITNPFYAIMPQWFLPFGIGIATLAAVVASQALISGSFTLINEAIRLNFWPKVKIKYPTDLKGQLYIPSLNWMLWAGCIFIVWKFREEGSSGMEAAYGLAIVMTMLMTTTLLNFYMILKRYNKFLIIALISTYSVIEISFLIANLHKFADGGYITLMIAILLMITMFTWYFARKIRNRYLVFVKLSDYLPVLEDLSRDLSVPKYATNLVYLTSADHRTEIESKIMYSILNKQPKRADIYWFVHVHVVDEPYTMEYRVNEFIHDDVIRIDFRLGFRVAPRISLMFKKVVEDMVKNKEVDVTSRYASLNKNNIIGDFRFILIEKFISYDNDLPFYEKWILDSYNILKKMGLSEEKAFGLDSSSVTIESFPLLITAPKEICLTRVD